MTAEDEAPARRGHMHTTTVRFDSETWELLVEYCHVLGIAHADFIRGSVQRRLGALLIPVDGATRLSARIGELAGRVDALDRIVAAVARFVGFTVRGGGGPR